MQKGVIIQASSRSDGNTSKIVEQANATLKFDIIDLKTKTIGHFDYEFANHDDDFNALFKLIVKQYDIIIFATPVYWYTMSGLLKVFLDRISDFLIKEKNHGRLLRGKHMAVISCGSNKTLLTEFVMPFRESAKYLGMHFLGHVHTWLENDTIPMSVTKNITQFISIINTANQTPLNVD